MGIIITDIVRGFFYYSFEVGMSGAIQKKARREINDPTAPQYGK